MKSRIKSIQIQNFKSCRDRHINLDSNVVNVKGANATGKTTILDAFWWVLFNKDSLGNEKFNVRPLDADGKQIDNIEIKVSVVFLIDGKEKEFTKVQKQKWVKKRGTDVTELQGNENLYEIDGYPKSEKDYKLAISDIVSEEIFKMITNPAYFPSLKWKEQREILMRFVDKLSDYDLASNNPEFTELLDELSKAPSLEDIQKKYQKALTEWKKKQAELPVRIDEIAKQKSDIDVAELELGKKAVIELIKSNKAKQDDISKQFAEYNKLSDEIMQLKIAESDLIRKANEDNNAKRRDIENKISDKKHLVKLTEATIRDTERDISDTEHIIQVKREYIDGLRSEYKNTQNLAFDENSVICSYCGQEYPNEKKEQIKAEFESNKSKELKRITESGNKAKAELDIEKETLRTLGLELEGHKQSLEMLNDAIMRFEEELSKTAAVVDISETDEYKAIKDEISKKENVLKSYNSSNDIRKSLEDENRELQAQLTEFEKRIVIANRNIEIDERIEELQEEKRAVAQKVADQEKMLYLLERFIRYKMDVVSASINSKFDGICWKLFENQINGGLKETCECTVNGVPYGSLNNGHKIVAGLQIIKSLQGLYDIYMPVFIDNAESVNEFNLPNMDNQLILLSVSDDKELKIEMEE